MISQAFLKNPVQARKRTMRFSFKIVTPCSLIHLSMTIFKYNPHRSLKSKMKWPTTLWTRNIWCSSLRKAEKHSLHKTNKKLRCLIKIIPLTLSRRGSPKSRRSLKWVASWKVESDSIIKIATISYFKVTCTKWRYSRSNHRPSCNTRWTTLLSSIPQRLLKLNYLTVHFLGPYSSTLTSKTTKTTIQITQNSETLRSQIAS